MAAKVVVVGSINVDFVTKIVRQPQMGETVTGRSFNLFVGGKGCNQAVACSRLGADVSFVARIGRDWLGNIVLSTLKNETMDLSHVTKDEKEDTGIANILVDDAGQNCIIVIPRANHALAPADVDRIEPEIAAAKVVLLQLEVPMPVIKRAAALARKHGVTVVLNSAPAVPLESDLLALVDILVPNETELLLVAGMPLPVGTIDIPTIREAASTVIKAGAKSVLVTLGERGSFLFTATEEPISVPAFAVSVVDTTAAGDSYCGALVAYLARAGSDGVSMAAAMQFASGAGSLAVTKAGALPSIPTRDSVLHFLTTATTLSS